MILHAFKSFILHFYILLGASLGYTKKPKPSICLRRPGGTVWGWRVKPVSPLIRDPWCTAAEGASCWGASPSLRGGVGQSHGGPTQTQVSHSCPLLLYSYYILKKRHSIFMFWELAVASVCLSVQPSVVPSRGQQWTQHSRYVQYINYSTIWPKFGGKEKILKGREHSVAAWRWQWGERKGGLGMWENNWKWGWE